MFTDEWMCLRPVVGHAAVVVKQNLRQWWYSVALTSMVVWQPADYHNHSQLSILSEHLAFAALLPSVSTHCEQYNCTVSEKKRFSASVPQKDSRRKIMQRCCKENQYPLRQSNCRVSFIWQLLHNTTNVN